MFLSSGGADVARAGPDGDRKGAGSDGGGRPAQLARHLHPSQTPGRHRTDL